MPDGSGRAFRAAGARTVRKRSDYNALGDCLGRLECKEGDMVLHVNRHGTKLSVSTPETGLVEFDRLLAVCTLYELQSGHDVALPYDAPRLLNTIAQGYERKVLRYLISRRITAMRELARSAPLSSGCGMGSSWRSSFWQL